MVHAQQMEEEKLKEKENKNKRDRTSSFNISQQRQDNRDRAAGSRYQGSMDSSHTNPVYKNVICRRAGMIISRARLILQQHQQGVTSSATSGQHQNQLYALQTQQDQEGSPNMVTGTLQVFHLQVYALLDPGAILSFVTPYIIVDFGIVCKILQNTSPYLP
ncbi:uncharacterized protein LOC124887169 [Capsicum annuum]|uniref:uncharacterized protein LOC124887169 n=1 Tax=Capsicum annuum TaxID=4072 RepID=UPI001FB0ADE3|nr:uncharacterized protein LOC124887169 [Capsicum annuum]